MFNFVGIMGRLVRDPEYRTTGSGIGVVNFTVAVDRDFSGKDGKEKETDFIDCTAWRKTAEFVAKYFQKGSMVLVTGSLQINKYTDKEGNNRRSATVNVSNVYFGESKSRQEPSAQPPPYSVPGGYENQFPETTAMLARMGYPPPVDPGNDFPMLTDDGDELPF